MSYSYTAVVRVTEFNESCKAAVAGLISCQKYFKQIIFVHPSYVDDETSMYNGWIEDREKLKSVSQIDFVYDLKAHSIHGDSIIEITPYCQLRPGGIEHLHAQIKASSVQETHFGLTTDIIVRDWSLFYGFLVISQFIDWWWQRVWNRGKLYQYTDVRVRTLICKGGQRYLPETSFFWRVWNNGCKSRIYGKDYAQTWAPRGYGFTLWYFYNHLHYRWSWWLFPYSFFYIIYTLAGWALIVNRNYTSLYILAIYLFQTISSYFICESYMKISNGALYYLAFPIYWALFPFFLIHAKLYVPQRV